MMEPRECVCEHCIEDAVLRETLKDGPTLVKCFWCQAKQVRALPMGELGDYFRELVEWAYESEPMGETIDVLLFDDWRIFSRRLKRKSSELKRELVLAVLRAGVRPKELCLYPDYAGRFVRTSSRLVENWVCELERFLSGEQRNEIQPFAEQDPKSGTDLPCMELDLPSEFEGDP